MITALMRFTKRCLSYVFPTWSQPLPSGGHLSREAVLCQLEIAFRRNLSFHTERRFREELMAASRRWVLNQTTYEVFCTEVRACLRKRPIWGNLIPSYGLYQGLSSIGFFGYSPQGSLGMRCEVPSVALYISSWLRHPYSLGKVLRKEMSNTTKGTLVPLQRDAETFLRNSSASTRGMGRVPAFVVGPGELDLEFVRRALRESDGVVHLLCTESVPPSLMLNRFPDSRLQIVLNNTLANRLLSGEIPIDEFLHRRVENVICGPQFIRPLADRGLRAQELGGRLGALWVRGAPSLLARTISHLCTIYSVIHVDGVDLYSKQTLYPLAPEKEAENRETEFLTLTSQAKHDLIFNFNIINRLEVSGILSASPGLKRILLGGESRYRQRLEKSIGANRK